jgi:hypothetical protein
VVKTGARHLSRAFFMLWVKVFKSCGEFQQLWHNSYYLEQGISAPHDADELMRQMSIYDMSFHSDTVSHVLTVACEVGSIDIVEATSNTCWKPVASVLGGWRNVGRPLPWRFCWQWRAAFPTGPMVRHFYRFALGENNVTWNDLGDMVYKPERAWLDDWSDRVNAFCPLIVNHLSFARGVYPEGGALVAELPSSFVSSGLVVTNAQRRARARRIQGARTGFEQLIGTAYGIILAWQQFREYWDLQLPDYYPDAVKGYAQICCAGGMKMVQQMQQLANTTLKSGDSLETSMYLNYGPTWESLISRSQTLDQKFNKALSDVSSPIPFQDAGGDYYYHQEDAFKMWSAIENIPAYIAPFLMLDWESTRVDGAAKEDMIDDYTPGWYDLDYNAGSIPPPPKKKGRRIDRTPLL